MVITCENCHTRFNLDPDLLKPTGSKVRCSQCRHVFTAFPETIETETTPVSDDFQPDSEIEGDSLAFAPQLSEDEQPKTGIPAETDSGQTADEGPWDDGFALKLSEVEELEPAADNRQQEDWEAVTEAIPHSATPPPVDENAPPVEIFENEFFSQSEEAAPEGAVPGRSAAEDLPAGGELKIEKKPWVRSAYVIWLIFFVLVGGAYWGLFFALKKGVEIPALEKLNLPFLNHLLPPAHKDQGHRKIVTMDINSRFVENDSAGRLFVITGKVRNDYPEPRGLIRAEGHLFAKGAKPVKSQSVYCGNFISDLDLSRLDIAEIHRQLGNRFGGGQKANLKIMPAQSIPFMIVFDHLPEDLEEFTIEVIGSIPMSL